MKYLLDQVSHPWSNTAALWMLSIRGLTGEGELPELDHNIFPNGGHDSNADLWFERMDKLASDWPALNKILTERNDYR